MAAGFRLRYREAGKGPALVHRHGAGGLRLTPAHALSSLRCAGTRGGLSQCP